MKPLNYLAFSLILLLFFSFLSSCNDDEEAHKIEGWDVFLEECRGRNYVLNDERTACECPEGTHFRLEKVLGSINEVTRCREILDGSFLYKADVTTCLYEIRDTALAVDGWENAYDATGMAEFDFENKSLSLWLGSSGHGLNQSLFIFGGGTVGGEPSGMTLHEDGSFSVAYNGLGNMNGECLDWKDRSPSCGQTPYFVTTTGRSNPQRTQITLYMKWTNCKGEVMDEGTIEMWKEW